MLRLFDVIPIWRQAGGKTVTVLGAMFISVTRMLCGIRSHTRQIN